MKAAIGILFFAMILNASAAERVSGPDGKVYAYKDFDGIKREMEVYFPSGHNEALEPVPGIIFFHGGGWGGGSRDAFKYQCAYFASRGLVAATVTYRLASKKEAQSLPKGQSRKRLCIPDAKSAIRWFKQNAEKLGVDPDRIITGGGSAGGHISLIATSNPGLNDPDDPKEYDTSVVARILFNPALSEGDSSDPEIDFIQHLSSKAPPSIAFFGSRDKWLKGWGPTYEKWKSLEGTTIAVEIAEDEGHAFFNYQPWADLTLISADIFLAKLGLLQGEPTLPLPESGEKLSPKTQ